MPNPEMAERFETRNPLGARARIASSPTSPRSCSPTARRYINGEVVTIDGGDWLQGAGSFSFLEDMLSEADWQALKPKKRG